MSIFRIIKSKNKCVEAVKEIASIQEPKLCFKITKILHIGYKLRGNFIFALPNPATFIIVYLANKDDFLSYVISLD